MKLTTYLNAYIIRGHNSRLEVVKNSPQPDGIPSWTLTAIRLHPKGTDLTEYKSQGFTVYRDCITVKEMRLGQEAFETMIYGAVQLRKANPSLWSN